MMELNGEYLTNEKPLSSFPVILTPKMYRVLTSALISESCYFTLHSATVSVRWDTRC